MVLLRWLLAAGVLAVFIAACGDGADVPADIAGSAAPVVRLNPASGPCGERVTVVGGGLDRDDESVLLALFPGTHTVLPAEEPLRSFSVVRLDDDGSFRTTMRMAPEEVAAELCAEGIITLVATAGNALAVAHYALE